MMNESYHLPVLLEQSVDLLHLQPGGTYVDVTFGGGGHTREILQKLEGGRLIAFDRDPDAEANLPSDSRIDFVPRDFQFFDDVWQKRQFGPVDGILADLGVSSHQFDTAERGFSFRFDAPLDMRMNPREGKSAADVLQEYEELALANLFRDLGEIPNSRKVARLIVDRRKQAPIKTTSELERVIEPCINPKRKSKYLAQVYQALRIEVNGEMASLQALLEASLKWLKPGGRLVVISYHSLEDRMVKRFMKTGNLAGIEIKDQVFGHSLSPFEQVTRRAIQADEEEILRNPRSRSARLRAVQKK
ncbi:MAG: 16S rRNA (cytosine(1402)-N(4))-methyltransferase RsmH [Bacteroidia bacterium]|nr:16S rRNA (cytosine(1402)-N(4))-methyltransferase RsmH [Bacteroidia bacterium]